MRDERPLASVSAKPVAPMMPSMDLSKLKQGCAEVAGALGRAERFDDIDKILLELGMSGGAGL